MKSACRVPIRQSSCEALTAPRGFPAAVPFAHHHLHLPLHLVLTPLERCYVLLRSDGPRSPVGLFRRRQRPSRACCLVGIGHSHQLRRLAFKQGSDSCPGSGISGWRACFCNCPIPDIRIPGNHRVITIYKYSKGMPGSRKAVALKKKISEFQ